jgi:16S rRNA (guanine527-N7)-methyltransferase
VEQISQLSSLLKKYSAEIGVLLEADQIRQFMIYLEQLRVWNRSVNLTSITLDEEIIIKHFVDSLAGLKAEEIRYGAKLLDVGTGAGFPGIPLRIVRQDLNITLLEPVQKKISFLHSIVGLLRLERVKIFYGTLERFMIDNISGQTFDYITTRALKYDFILRKGSTLLVPGGKCILYLSQPINKLELGIFGRDWSMVTEYMFDLPRGLGRRVVSILSASQGQPV